ncbi:hypothetical protein [Rubrivivax rivuli]|uniref:Uncharacterized protein n=1 Tax=Rubrivivax rivuli TaxID=1862385 RepID=A0A437RAI8_9BURK|nr:hypothetical protein [Rubrivivax rivuli]RVU43798.1 hypothetical protein EOE66_19190 [Rubrivivax rivuli]
MNLSLPRALAGLGLPALLAAATLALHGPATALPMGPYESWMLMVDSTPSTRSLAANYALVPTWAPGGVLRRWDEPVAHGASLRRESAGLSLTHRLHRWNLPHAQANLWLQGEAGQLRRAGGHGQIGGRGTYGAAAFMADYETTRIYFGGSLKALRSEGRLRHDVARLRTGFSFWEAEYEGIQPWLLIEAERTRYSPGAMQESTLLTPMLRFIHRRWFVEIGVNRDGGMFNLMFNH